MKIIRAAAFLIALLSWMPLHAATPAPADTKAASPAPASPAPAHGPAEDLPAVEAPQFPQAQSKLDDWKQTLDQVEGALHTRTIDDATESKVYKFGLAQAQTGDLVLVLTPLAA